MRTGAVRFFLSVAAWLAACGPGEPASSDQDVTSSVADKLPNIVIILTDDKGYGDLSSQGHPLIRTPNIDRLAANGQHWTSFYASSPLCNPSLFALMTGRMPIRIQGKGKNSWSNLPVN